MFRFDIPITRPISQQLEKVEQNESLIFKEGQRHLNPTKIEDAWFTYSHGNHDMQPDYFKYQTKMRKIRKKNSKNRSKSKRYKKRLKPSIPVCAKPHRAKKLSKSPQGKKEEVKKVKKIKEEKWKKNFAISSSTNFFTMAAPLFSSMQAHCHKNMPGDKKESKKEAKGKEVNKPKVLRSRTLESRRKEFKKKKMRSKSSRNLSKPRTFLYEPTMHSRRDLKEFEAVIGVQWHEMTIQQRKEINEFIKNR